MWWLLLLPAKCQFVLVSACVSEQFERVYRTHICGQCNAIHVQRTCCYIHDDDLTNRIYLIFKNVKFGFIRRVILKCYDTRNADRSRPELKERRKKNQSQTNQNIEPIVLARINYSNGAQLIWLFLSWSFQQFRPKHRLLFMSVCCLAYCARLHQTNKKKKQKIHQ